jgi:hypothetical protein
VKAPLSIYLHDHLAGAEFAVELLGALEHEHGGNELGAEVGGWKTEIETDREVLREIVERLGASQGTIKEVTSWIAAKAASLKLRRQSHGDLGTFESLEALTLGILGKEKLWQALAGVASHEERLAGFDFVALEQRARQQHDRVETYRRRFAARAFTIRPA